MSERTGTLTIDGDKATMTFVRHLPYPIDAVWAAITDPESRKDWFGPTTIDPRVGGEIEMVATEPPAPPERKRMTGRILVWDPPKVFEHEWNQAILKHGGTVRYELAEEDGGTALTFTHRGIDTGSAHGFIPGTHAFFDRMEAHLAGRPIPNWQARYDEVAPNYPSWREFSGAEQQ
ncbi:SRPBCC family protein [Pseudonocardia acaciae]|uniref:SRPBCC family protein n=1 Tax=Pseudonocardia acaciae TaxID=551276 RepID=UPI00048E093C|nr:SRPBCC family protein [Pseudonocardia acaciae]